MTEDIKKVDYYFVNFFFWIDASYGERLNEMPKNIVDGKKLTNSSATISEMDYLVSKVNNNTKTSRYMYLLLLCAPNTIYRHVAFG